jgi:MFS transporter, PPP family, 3-phenylpropionic acid transporter
VDQADLASIVWVSGMLLVAGGGAALLLPGLRSNQAVTGGTRISAFRDCALLLQIAVFRRTLLIAALVEGSHALNDTFAVIRWRAAGVSLPTVGMLWSEAVLSEVLVFSLIGPILIRHIGPGGACALAAGAGVVRWSVLASTTSPILLAFVQPLHGLTFALLHLASMRVIVLVMPLRLAATAQSIYGTLCIGFATALLTLISGVLYERMDGHAFFVMAGLCLLALPMCGGLRSSVVQAFPR